MGLAADIAKKFEKLWKERQSKPSVQSVLTYNEKTRTVKEGQKRKLRCLNCHYCGKLLAFQEQTTKCRR